MSAQLEASKPAPQVVKNPESYARSNKAAYFTISRHASPRGGFLFRSALPVFELTSVLILVRAARRQLARS